MAVYAINKTSNATIIADIKAALNDAGILETTYYETNSLIVKITLCNKVIRMVPDSARILVYVGDSWTSGDAVNNQVTIVADANGTTSEINVIITDKVFCVGYRVTYPRIINAIFTRLDSTNQEYVALGIEYNDASRGAILRDLTNNVQFDARQLNCNIISTDGYYYASDLICAKLDTTLQATGIQGIKSLQKTIATDSQYVRYGNDIVIPGGATNGVTSYFPRSILITNGYSWAPA
jgi:hypothetical protein